MFQSYWAAKKRPPGDTWPARAGVDAPCPCRPPITVESGLPAGLPALGTAVFDNRPVGRRALAPRGTFGTAGPAAARFAVIAGTVAFTGTTGGACRSTPFPGRDAGEGAARLKPRDPVFGQGLADVALDAGQVADLVKGGEGDGDARCPCPAGAADAVDIVLGEFRQVEVDDMADAGYIQAAGRHVGGHQKPYPSLLHGGDGPVAGILGHVAMEGRGGMSLIPELDGHILGVALGGGEDDRLVDVAIGDQVLKQPVFVGQVVGHMEALFDILMGRFGARDLDPLRFAQQPPCQARHGIVHGGREEEGLAVGGGSGGDPVHVIAEPHVEHPVGFVEDQHLKAGKVEAPPIQQVHEAPRRGYDQVHRSRKEPELFPIGHAAEDGAAAYPQELAVGADRVGHLVGQLPGGGQDEHSGTAAGLLGRGCQTLEGWKDKGCGLAGAGLGSG